MNDHEWLHKIRVAYTEYARQNPSEAQAAETFIRWLHRQYGMLYQEHE